MHVVLRWHKYNVSIECVHYARVRAICTVCTQDIVWTTLQLLPFTVDCIRKMYDCVKNVLQLAFVNSDH